MANPIDKEGLELARTINARLVTMRSDIAALELAMGSVSSTWDGITGKPAAVTSLTGTNTGDQDLSGLLSSTTAASTYAPIATTVTIAGNQELSGYKTFSGNAIFTGSVLFYDTANFSYESSYAAGSHRTALGLGVFATDTDAGNLTGNIAVARIANALTAPGPIGGTTPAPITGTTGTFNGNTSVPAHTFTALRINGGSYFCYGGSGFMLALDGNYNTGTRWQSFVDGKVRISNATNTTGVYFDLLTSGTLKVRNLADNADGNLTAANLTASGVIILGTYMVGTVPSASTNARGMIYVSNESGGATMAYSNGTNWKRVYDNANIS